MFEDFDDFKQKNNLDFPYLIRLNNLCNGEGSYLITNEQELEKNQKKLQAEYERRAHNGFTKKICVEFYRNQRQEG